MPSKPASIKMACRETDKIFSGLVKKMSSFRTEIEVARFIKREIKKAGFVPAFEPIVGAAESGAEPHHKPQKIPLKRGFCVIDFGVRINGYCSDMTRTVFFGKPTKKERALYNLVLFSQQKAVKLLCRGAFGVDLWRVSFKALKPHSKKFVHGLGHGLGKHIHVQPFMKKKSQDVLKEGDIVTVEPGIYFKNRFGIRIEDDFLITKNGSKLLSKSTKKLLCFKVPV